MMPSPRQPTQTPLMYLSVVAATFICYSPAECKGDIGLFLVVLFSVYPPHFNDTFSILILSHVFPTMLTISNLEDLICI